MQTFFQHSKTLHLWECDLQQKYTTQNWERALRFIYKATSCTFLWELTQCITQCRYITPLKIATFDHNASPVCWNCEDIGSLLHVLWEHPILISYWVEVFYTDYQHHLTSFTWSSTSEPNHWNHPLHVSQSSNTHLTSSQTEHYKNVGKIPHHLRPWM